MPLLFVTATVEPTKHTGALSKFDELFVRQGVVSKEMSRILHHAFDMRQAGEVINLAEGFVQTIEAKLSEES